VRAISPRATTGLVAVFALLPLAGERYPLELGSEMMILGLFAVSFNLLLGYAGLVSFGHAAFFALGAYGCAILLTTLQWPIVAALPAAVALAALAAAVVGAFCVRLAEIYFAMLTLAFAQLVWAIGLRWSSVTGGDNGFVGIRMPAFLDGAVPLYYFVFAVVLLSLGVLHTIGRSAFGQILVATRENPMRAAFVGVDVKRMRLAAFVLSGAFSGVAGGLFALHKGSVFLETAYWTRSADVLIMTILGGIYSFVGPFLGAIVLVLLNRLTAVYTVYWPTVLGAILLLVLFFMPNGLIGLFKRGAQADAGTPERLQAFRRLLGHR
jgi:branched-chain amino acid transport system permease protein